MTENDQLPSTIEIMEPLCAVFRRHLKSLGHKYTPERAQILDTAAEICNLLGNCDRPIGHLQPFLTASTQLEMGRSTGQHSGDQVARLHSLDQFQGTLVESIGHFGIPSIPLSRCPGR